MTIYLFIFCIFTQHTSFANSRVSYQENPHDQIVTFRHVARVRILTIPRAQERAQTLTITLAVL